MDVQRRAGRGQEEAVKEKVTSEYPSLFVKEMQNEASCMDVGAI